MPVKNTAAKSWTLSPSADGRRWSAYPAGDAPAQDYALEDYFGEDYAGPPSLAVTLAGAAVGSGAATGNLVASGAGTGFATRPYFFPERSTLLARIAANDPEATGSAANNFGQPLGFGPLSTAAGGSSGRGTFPPTGSYDDIHTRDFALWGNLTNNNTLKNLAKAEVLAQVAAVNPNGLVLNAGGGPAWGYDPFQHCEETVGHIALVTDCCHSVFTSGELATVAAWLNSAVAYVESRSQSYWPDLYVGGGHHAVNNNYQQNQTLMWAMAGLCSEGWNASASAHRAHFETLAEDYIAYFNGGLHSLGYVGPQLSEGRYYSSYIRQALWAMDTYDKVMGTTYIARLGAAGPTWLNQLEMGLALLLPRGARGFHDGSEPNNGAYAPSATNISEYFQMLTGMADPSNVITRAAKAVLTRSDYTGDTGINFWSRADKGFSNFVFSNRGVTALSPISGYTKRHVSLPNPGGARDIFMSSGGLDGSASTRKMIVWSTMIDYTSGSAGPGYGHSNVASPGFQWAQGLEPIITYPEYGGNVGTANEGAGDSPGSRWANIVGLASGNSSTAWPPSIAWPIRVYTEDNTAAGVPHFYIAINAQPAWSQCSVYRRDYVTLDDVQVQVIFDRVATAGSNVKTWRLHTLGLPTVSAGVASWTVQGGSTNGRVFDAYSTDGTAMVASALPITYGAGADIRVLTQTGTSNNWRSLKVLDINGRVSSVTLNPTTGSGFLEVAIVISGVTRTVRFFDNGTHATVS